MNLTLVVGSEGLLGKKLVQMLVEKPNSVIVGFDRFKGEMKSIPNFTYVRGSVLNADDLLELKNEIYRIQSLHGIIGQMNGILNCFAAPEFSFRDLQPPESLEIGDARIWAWRNYPSQDFVNQYETNVVGVHKLLTTICDSYIDSEKLSIVNFSSMYSLRVPNQDLFMNPDRFVFKAPAYSASKAALNNYTQFLAGLFQGKGIRVNSIVPGSIETDQSEKFKIEYGKATFTGRMMKPEDVVGAVEFLLSDSSKYMNGACLTIDGGWSAK
jgi:NAD(P)-dependent dehydrogenase (short-subunit alcohol dehydrogenase family)